MTLRDEDQLKNDIASAFTQGREVPEAAVDPLDATSRDLADAIKNEIAAEQEALLTDLAAAGTITLTVNHLGEVEGIQPGGGQGGGGVGTPGPQGPPGPAGTDGIDGADGVTGATGAAGSQGPAGTAAASGGAGEIQYNDGATVLTASNNLWWDNANGLFNISGSVFALTLFNPTAIGPEIRMFHSSANPANNDVISNISAYGLNDSFAKINYTALKSCIGNSANGAGFFQLSASVNGIARHMLEISPNGGEADVGVIFRTLQPTYAGSPGMIWRINADWAPGQALYQWQDNDGGNVLTTIDGGGSITASLGIVAAEGKFTSGLTGALNVLPNGSSFIKAGQNITTTTASNGQITVATNPTYMPIAFYGTTTATSSNPAVAGQVQFSQYEITASTIKLRVVLSTTNAASAATAILYNITSGSTVDLDAAPAYVTLTTTNTTPTSLMSQELIGATNFGTGSNIYELRYYTATGSQSAVLGSGMFVCSS